MNPFVVVSWAWRGAAACSLRPRIWAPLLIAFGIQTALLLTLILFFHPVLLPLALPLVRALGGPEATHYPALYYSLPAMVTRMNVVVDTAITSILVGIATLLFARAFGSDTPENTVRRAIRRAPALIVTSAVTLGVLVLGDRLTALVPMDLVNRSFFLRWGMRGFSMFLFIIVQSLMAYTAAWIVLAGHGIWPAIRDSVRVTARTFIPTFLVVGIPVVIMFPISYMTRGAARLKPEMVANLLGLGLVVQLILTFFLVGAITRLFVWRLEATR